MIQYKYQKITKVWPYKHKLIIYLYYRSIISDEYLLTWVRNKKLADIQGNKQGFHYI